MTDIAMDDELETGTQSGNAITPPAPVFVPEDYADDLRDFQLSKTQQDELLRTLWGMMVIVVDLGLPLDDFPVVSKTALRGVEECFNDSASSNGDSTQSLKSPERPDKIDEN